MKHLLFIVMGLSAHLFATAQGRGQLMLGGSATYQHTHQNEYSGSAFINSDQKALTVTPRIAYFISDRFAVGAEASIQSDRREAQSQQFSGVASSRTNTIAAGVFARSYWQLGKSFSVFGHGGLNYLSFTAKNHFLNQPEFEAANGSGFNLTVYPGVNYTLGRRLMIEVALQDLLSFSTLSTKVPPQNGQHADATTTAFSLGSNMNVAAGIHVLIGK